MIVFAKQRRRHREQTWIPRGKEREDELEIGIDIYIYTLLILCIKIPKSFLIGLYSPLY